MISSVELVSSPAPFSCSSFQEPLIVESFTACFCTAAFCSQSGAGTKRSPDHWGGDGGKPKTSPLFLFSLPATCIKHGPLYRVTVTLGNLRMGWWARMTFGFAFVLAISQKETFNSSKVLTYQQPFYGACAIKWFRNLSAIAFCKFHPNTN